MRDAMMRCDICDAWCRDSSRRIRPPAQVVKRAGCRFARQAFSTRPVCRGSGGATAARPPFLNGTLSTVSRDGRRLRYVRTHDPRNIHTIPIPTLLLSLPKNECGVRVGGFPASGCFKGLPASSSTHRLQYNTNTIQYSASLYVCPYMLLFHISYVSYVHFDPPVGGSRAS